MWVWSRFLPNQLPHFTSTLGLVLLPLNQFSHPLTFAKSVHPQHLSLADQIDLMYFLFCKPKHFPKDSNTNNI